MIALFIITGGIGVVAALYIATMGTQDRDVEAALMVSLARSRMNELRFLASDPGGWQALAGESGSQQPPEWPGFTVHTAVSDVLVPFPSAGLRERDYRDSFQQVELRVEAPSGREFRLASRIGIPPSRVGTLNVQRTTGSSPLPRDQQADFAAALLDTGGNPIPDLSYSFYIDFGSGYGRLQENPNGQEVSLFNQIPNAAGGNLYTGGAVRIVARTYYAGEEYRGVSDPLPLSP